MEGVYPTRFEKTSCKESEQGTIAMKGGEYEGYTGVVNYSWRPMISPWGLIPTFWTGWTETVTTSGKWKTIKLEKGTTREDLIKHHRSEKGTK